MFYDEWRLLEVFNDYGDINSLHEYPSKKEALKALEQRKVPDNSHFLTVEGQRTYDSNSPRKWTQTGICKGEVSQINKHWELDYKGQWYRSGDEPGFQLEPMENK